MTVDEIARLYPDSLYTFSFTLSTGITTSLMSQIQTQLQLSSVQSGNLEHLLHQAFTIFSQKDATLFEINPMTMSKDGSIASLSTNLVIDDAAKKRQPELFLLRDKSKEVAEEVEAEEHGLVYVKMEGDIGVVVNGAGLAMATNDAIGFHGGKSANFLDTGGKATTETMLKAFEIVTRDERVRAILVNIYGGRRSTHRPHPLRHDGRVHHRRRAGAGHAGADGSPTSGNQLGAGSQDARGGWLGYRHGG